MKPENKEVRIGVRITEQVKNELQVLAANEKRSLSDFIRLELEKIVADKKSKS